MPGDEKRKRSSRSSDAGGEAASISFDALNDCAIRVLSEIASRPHMTLQGAIVRLLEVARIRCGIPRKRRDT